MDSNEFNELLSELHDLGYSNLTFKPKGERPSISGSVDADLSGLSKSVPEEGKFKTLDAPEEGIPDDIVDLCETYGVDVTVLGHGPDRLSIYISE